MEQTAPGTSFEELGEYYLLNGGSHLKPPARIGAPALTWHTALWIPPLGAGVSFGTHRDTWLQSVDWFLASFARKAYDMWQSDPLADDAEVARLRPHAFTEGAPSADASSPVTLFRHRVELWSDTPKKAVRFDQLDDSEVDQYRNEVVSFKFFFHGIPMKLRASLHNEIVALTFIAELNFRHLPGKDPSIPDALKSHFNLIAETLKSRVEALSVSGRNAQHESDVQSTENFRIKNKLATSSNYLYNGFWKDVWDVYGACLWPAFDMHVYRKDASKLQRERPGDGCTGLAPDIGRRFGDFRGVVLAGEMTKNNGVLNWAIDQPFPDHAKAESGTPLHTLTDRYALALADALVPLLEAAEPEVAEAAPAAGLQATESTPAAPVGGTPLRVEPGRAGSFRMGHEHTAARFLDGRVLYLSSLAAHQRWQVREGVHEPLRFLLVVPRKNRWQLGRLIERLHLLGTLRLASLKDLIALNVAGEELRSFGLTLDEVEKGDNLRPPDLNASLSEINARCNGGVLYRVERSRYYTATFKELTKLLRIKRIEGYQPYDEFVYRRLGSTWDSIDRLGNRIERARRRVDSINASLQVREQQMQTKEQQKQTSEQTNQTREQTKLLEFAEFAAVVPIGYYGGHILVSIIAGIMSFIAAMAPFLCQPRTASTRSDDLDPYFLGAASILVMAVYCYYVLPALKGRRKGEDAALALPPANSEVPPVRLGEGVAAQAGGE